MTRTRLHMLSFLVVAFTAVLPACEVTLTGFRATDRVVAGRVLEAVVEGFGIPGSSTPGFEEFGAVL